MSAADKRTASADPPKAFAPLGYPIPVPTTKIYPDQFHNDEYLPTFPERAPVLQRVPLAATFIDTENLRPTDPANVQAPSLSADFGIMLSTKHSLRSIPIRLSGKVVSSIDDNDTILSPSVKKRPTTSNPIQQPPPQLPSDLRPSSSSENIPSSLTDLPSSAPEPSSDQDTPSSAQPAEPPSKKKKQESSAKSTPKRKTKRSTK
ncbi:hypothetical protein CANCADRAFT_148252 [Tortispora caseinolytica NRRL Y-17796]|uniref:Uncharacterized protein n=1 Tax=Tortispora caseinolytica NRRL Y-17796 TaxID=767744 RepID=A0A1E4TI35_9ASCO|nr:hypothetical protein CANCADRAFT_148252 [Tortispora caseinolytica NRRL Y-17796]